MIKILVLLPAILLTACGASIFYNVDNRDPAIDATVALEQGRSQDAIDILEDALLTDATNPTYLSLLGTAQAQLVGVDFLRIVLRMAANDTTATTDSTDSSSGSSTTTTDSSGNDITFLFVVLPDATDENINGLDTAIATIESIADVDKISADQFKLTIFYTARLALRTKKFDADGDGLVSPAELLDLSDEDADAIIDSLLNAGDALEAAGDAGASAEQIEELKNAIESSEGDTQAEKLRNYLGGTDTSTTT